MQRVLVTAAVLCLGFLVLAPVGTMVWESLHVDAVTMRDGREWRGHIMRRDETDIVIRIPGETTTRSLPRAAVVEERRAPSLQHYEGVVSGGAKRNMLLATLGLAGAATLLAFLIGLPLGILFAATDLPGRHTWELAATLPLVLPPILLAIAVYRDLLHVQPEFMRAVLVFGFCLFPLVSLFTARAVRATGGALLDAARVQASPREALLRVVLGPALPGAAAGALLVFVFVVANFAVPDFLGVTTAKNTITVYANAVFRAWSNDKDPGAATAAGMPATALAVAAFALVLIVEARRGAATVGGEHRAAAPLPLGRWRWPAVAFVAAVLCASLLLPCWRHVETASGKHFGDPVAKGGATATVVDQARARPAGFLDGLGKGLRHERIGDAVLLSLLLAGGGALVAVLAALLLVEAGRGRPRLDRCLLVASFLPVAVPPMSFAVGWVTFVGPERAAWKLGPVLLLGARLLPFATFAIRAARARIAPALEDAAAVAGLTPLRRFRSVVFPLIASGAALGFLLAFLFGLREVDALVFTRSGAETLPVQLYNMIHYGYDVQVAGLSLLWTLGVAFLLLGIRFLGGVRLRLLP